MFETNVSQQGSPKRFLPILALSVLAHGAVLALVFGAFVYGTASRFGMFAFEDDPNYVNQYRVTRLDHSKPLVLPRGFYAVKEAKPLEETDKEKPKPEPKKPEPKKPEPKKPEPEKKADPAGDDAETAKKDEPPAPEPPAPVPTAPASFGKIEENALRPHLRNVVAAYEEGKIPDTPFRVAVSCKVEPDGSLSDIRIVKSSGNPIVDETALNLFRELGAMKALQPLASLSSLSLTLDRGESTSSLSAVGFAKDVAQAESLKMQLDIVKFGAGLKAANADQRALVQQSTVSQDGNRVAVSASMPTSRAGDMMRRSFGAGAPGAAPSKPTA